MAKPTKDGSGRAALSSSSRGGVADGRSVAEAAWAPLAYGHAARIGLIGDTGTGKTEAARQLIAEYLRRSRGAVLVVDDKEPKARFAGQERLDADDMAARRPDPEPRVVVFRGDVRSGVRVDCEAVARAGWRMAVSGTPVCLVFDELAQACGTSRSRGQWRPGSHTLPLLWSQGRAVGASVIWATQMPQGVPLEVGEQSGVLLCFRLFGRALDRLREWEYVRDDRLAAVIEALPGDDAPPEERGLFVVLRRGRPWDGRVYRFPLAR